MGVFGFLIIALAFLFRLAVAAEGGSTCAPEWRCDKTGSSGTGGAKGLHKATWVWNTSRILGDAGEQQALVRFLVDHGFDLVFLQLPNSDGDIDSDGGIRLDTEKLRPLLKKLRESGIQVHALDGDKAYALPEGHHKVLKTVENIIRYNQSVDKSEQFTGIHYDIEPYLLPEFRGSGKDNILKSYLSLLSSMQQRTRGGNLALGVDIPFWYDSVVRRLDFQGVRKSPTEHILDLVDNVGIMDYRTTASGQDGIISNAAGKLSYAARVGKQVFVGLEVSPLHEEGVASTKLTFNELGPRRLLEEMEKTVAGCAGFSSFAGFALHHCGSYKTFLSR